MIRHTEHVMGTVFPFAVRDPGPGTDAALRRIVARLHRIDAVFSPHRADGETSRLGRGELTEHQCRPEVAEVPARCRAPGDRGPRRPPGRPPGVDARVRPAPGPATAADWQLRSTSRARGGAPSP